ncbi:unnamed protein product [Cylindrotheca closterium]|uniref:Uncharacterized protein n=1 Tax=Cylindrotheca closterium TaxID=2856 RepID=A0AAD2CNW5_9STRA|nr:unnamed protein product [Cylindrotheca closterium]
MRESQTDHGSVHYDFSVVSSTSTSSMLSADDDDASTTDNTSQENQKRTLRDPEPMTTEEVDLSNSARNGGNYVFNSNNKNNGKKQQSGSAELSNDLQNELQTLFKIPKQDRGQRAGAMGAGKQGNPENDIRTATLDLRKEVPRDCFDIVATRPRDVKGYNVDELRLADRLLNAKANANEKKPPREFDEYQIELFRTIKEFEARKNQRLQKLGFVNEPRSAAKADESFIEDDGSSSLESEELEVLFAAAAAEDRNDAPSGWIPNPLPKHPAPSEVINWPKPSAMITNNISSRIPPPMPHRACQMAAPQQRQANNFMKQKNFIVPQKQQQQQQRQQQRQRQQAKNFVKHTDAIVPRQQQKQRQAKNPVKQNDDIVSHIANVANHMVQSQKRLASSTGNKDLNRRMLRENTSELLRNLAAIQRFELERNGTNNNDTRKIESFSRMHKETKATARPNDLDARVGPPQSNLMLLRAKRDEAAMTVRKELAASKLMTSALGGAHQMTISPGKGNKDNSGKRNEKLHKPGKSSKVRKKPMPSDQQRVSRHRIEGDEAEFDLYEDRADRLDRVKSMIEELRYLRSAKCGNNE